MWFRRKKNRSGDCECVLLVSERRSWIQRANSLNTGWVKVPVNSQPSQSPPTGYAYQVRVSKVRSTLLRDKRSNRRDNPLPKLQCAGRRFENLYVTSPISAIC